MRDYEFLKNLKAGDTVIVSGGFSGDSKSMKKVTKVTKTQIVIDCGNYVARFRIDTGLRCGDSTYNRSQLLEATPERLEAVRRVSLIRAIERLTKYLDKLPTETLNLFHAKLHEVSPQPTAS